MTTRPERTMKDTLLTTAALLEMDIVTTKLLPRVLRLMAEGQSLEQIATEEERQRATAGREPADGDILFLVGSWLNAFERYGRYKLGEQRDTAGQLVEERIWAFGLVLERIATFIGAAQSDIGPRLAMEYAGLIAADGD